MRKRILMFLIPLVLLLSPVIMYAAPITVEGTIQGFNCVTQGKYCPRGEEDPLVTTERAFVLLASDGKKYYFVPNVDRIVMARHVAKQVRIKGDFNGEYNAIRAHTIEAQQNGRWRTIYASSFCGPP